MLDKVLVTIAMLLLITFLGIIVVFVKEIDLAVVVVLVVAMAIYEVWYDLRAISKRNRRSSGK